MRFNPIKLLEGLLCTAPALLLTLAACGGGGGGSSTTPIPVTAPTAAPTAGGPVAGCNAIDLNWGAVAGATGYNVYGAASSVGVISASNKLTATPDTTTSYTDTSATTTTRYYQITAVNSAGEGPGSNVVSGKILGTCTNVGGSIQGNSLVLSTAVSTLAGAVGKNLFIDGTGTSAQFNNPASVTTDGTNLYVADTFNNAIRKIVISTGAVSTVAGTGVAGNVDTAAGPAQFSGPQGITTDGAGNLYVADTGNNAIRKIDTAGTVTTLAGSTTGTFSSPAAITFDGTNLYVADSGHNIIKMVTLLGTPTTFSTSIPSPQGITFDGTGLNFYVTSHNSITSANTVFQVTPAGAVTSFLATGLNFPQGITTDGTNLYIVNNGSYTILTTPINNPLLSTLIAGASGVAGSTDATVGTNARFYYPGGITTDGTNLYVTDTANDTIRKIQ